MDISVAVNQAIDTVKTVWDKQTRPRRYLAIIAIAFPATIILRQLYWYFYRKYHSLPPGPNGLPVIGITLTVHSGTTPRINLAEKYGPILYTSYIGLPYVILSSSKLVKQINTQKQFLNRVSEEFYHPNNVYQPSIFTFGQSQALPLISEDGDSWTKRRKLTQNTLFKILNNKNVAKSLKQTFDKDVSKYFNEIITSKNGQWTDTKEIFQYVSLSTIYAAIFGERLERDSDLFESVKEYVYDTLLSIMMDSFVVSMPFVKYFYGKKLLQMRTKRDTALLKLVNEKVNSTNKDREKSYIDYIHDELTKDEVIADLMVLFIAGTDTTTSTLQFGVTLLAKYEDVQERVRKEILGVMGKEYNISLINKCPIFRAAVHEILRISSIVFMGVERGSYTDYWLTMDDGKKYKIPKNTTIITNLDYIHIFGGKDGKGENWKRVNKDEIILENFLIKDESNGELRFVKNDSFIPFGVGKRDCVGRQLAMKELYYTLGYLLINYKMSYTNDKDKTKDIAFNMRDTSSGTAFLSPVIPLTVERI